MVSFIPYNYLGFLHNDFKGCNILKFLYQFLEEKKEDICSWVVGSCVNVV